MPCYHPLDAWRKNGGGITFRREEGFNDLPYVSVPCGQCIGCRLERSRNWAIRCVHEASLHDQNCFLTLTYADENTDHLPRSFDPETGEIGPGSRISLNKRDICLFMKRLRKRFGSGIRFLQCGEYGDLNGRPHHHVLLFGFAFSDLELLPGRRPGGVRLFRSAVLEELWPYGHSAVGELTFESAAYVARYVVKKVTGKFADWHYCGLEPEYITMSRRPGIAHDWIEKNLDDVYPKDKVFIREGKVSRPPKYYDKIYDLKKEDFWKIRRIRVCRAERYNSDRSVRRLCDRETCQLLKAKKLVRNLEAIL